MENGLPAYFWLAHDLETGRPTGDRLMCSAETLERWATRMATEEEIGRIAAWI